MTQGTRPIWLGPDIGAFDHARVHFQILTDDRLGAYEQSVYLGLAKHADVTTGIAFPSLATLAAYSKLDQRTIRRAIKVLVVTGYVRSKLQRGKPNEYALLPCLFIHTPVTDDRSHEMTQDSDVPTPGQKCQGTPVTDVLLTRTLNENQEQAISTDSQIDKTVGFSTIAETRKMLRGGN